MFKCWLPSLFLNFSIKKIVPVSAAFSKVEIFYSSGFEFMVSKSFLTLQKYPSKSTSVIKIGSHHQQHWHFLFFEGIGLPLI
jgi:hypothetical protein